MQTKISKSYLENIQQPLHEHRTEMSTKFENRLDYIDLSAYKVGQIKSGELKKDETSKSDEKNGEDDDEERLHMNNTSQETRVFKRVCDLE